jgi:hypothetical protein
MERATGKPSEREELVMAFWNRNANSWTDEDDRNYVIDWLRQLTDKDYEKILKIVEIRREADDQVRIVEAGSKKAAKELEKEEQTDDDIEAALDRLMEAQVAERGRNG